MAMVTGSIGMRRARVGMTGLGGVGGLRDGPWIKAGGSGSVSGVPPAGPWVKGRVLVCAGLGIEAEALMYCWAKDTALHYN